ncbi:beta-ketoacyl synthase N-terminal-like domain-containing protein [Mannheimia haemolytica]
MICGGVDTLSPLTISGFSSLEVLSNQQTNPFSANRNGINIGEGAAVFVMSREPLDEHRIQLLGYGSSSTLTICPHLTPKGKGQFPLSKMPCTMLI